MTKSNISTDTKKIVKCHSSGIQKTPIVEPGQVQFNVAGVTFEGRQKLLALCRSTGVTTCTIQIDPVHGIDPNAKSVHVQLDDESLHVGFVPRRLTRLVRSGRAKIVDIDTFELKGSPVYYCKVRADRM